MSKYLELVEGSFNESHFDKQKNQNPYVAYSIKDDRVIYNIVPKEDGYTLTVLKKVDISNISYEEVDLGLPSGLKWANKNIGAQTVDDYGTYFSWGNTDGYTVSGTKFLTVDEACQLFSSVFGQTATTKEEFENMLSQVGMTIDNLGTVDGYSFDENTYNSTSGGQFTGNTLDAEHDAATSIMRDTWRMPTTKEYQELVKAVKSSDGTKGILTCQYEYIDLNGEQQSLVVYNDAESGYFSVEGLVDDSPIFKTILGIRFTNDVTGASVYFPPCGLVNDSVLAFIGFFGGYWSSSIDDTAGARYFIFNPNDVSALDGNNRYSGLCVRAVK